MMSTNNILSPAFGKPVIVPTQDIVLGLYYATREKAGVDGENKVFANPDEVRSAYDATMADLQASIRVRIDKELVQTTVGRILLREIIPPDLPFSLCNKVMGKKEVADLIDACYRICGNKKTVILADRLKNMGFEYATRAGISISIEMS